MNTENLKVGQVFKNYKSMCEFLEIEAKRGNSKPAQVKELQRYFNYHQSVREITITEIYDRPLTKEENKRNLPVYI